MIQIEKLHKSYVTGSNRLHILKGIDLKIESGEWVSIMGSSSSGKSTLLNVIGNFDTYDSGGYNPKEIPIRNLNEKKAAWYRSRMTGFVFQFFNLISHKSAVENVVLPLYYQYVGQGKRNKTALYTRRIIRLKDGITEKNLKSQKVQAYV